MATFTQLASGNWRVQVRRKTRYVAETFRRRKDGEEWALEMERNIDRNGLSRPRTLEKLRTFGDLIDLHDEDMREVGKPPRRSKAAVMESLKDALGTVKLPQLNRERLIEFGRKRAKQGAGPATLAIDLSFIRTIVSHAAAVHGIEVSAEEVRLARIALKHLDLVGKGVERDRRPTQDEIDELIEHFETNPRQVIPMGASCAMRLPQQCARKRYANRNGLTSTSRSASCCFVTERIHDIRSATIKRSRYLI
ncbi:MAG: Integrase [Bradyrhizobium sp.]|nr:Integrase [Bradyrhizobium sp.]